jgi:hypothetical protein
VTGREERPAKALIYRLTATAAGAAEQPPTVSVQGDPIPVQFNPTTLRIDRTNDTSGGLTTRAQRRHRPNEGHATLSLELEYDTAEGGPDGTPLDVRTRTQDLRQFAEPPAGAPRRAPPRMRFIWGNFRFDGIVSRINEEIDYFSADGTALRAKVSLSISGQDERFESNATGPGARTDTAATPAGGAPSGTGPGSTPTTTPDRAEDAQDGESVQQALSRLGVDPAAWRSAMAGLDSPLGLTAGAQIQVNTSVSAGAGLGTSAGFSAGVSGGIAAGMLAGGPFGASASVSAEAAAALGFGESAAASASASAGVAAGGALGASAQAAAGFALSASGGVDAAMRAVLEAQAEAGVARARGSFAVPGSASVDAGVVVSGAVSASAGASASDVASVFGGASTQGGGSASVRATARVDRRAVSYGRGVPLKPPATRR